MTDQTRPSPDSAHARYNVAPPHRHSRAEFCPHQRTRWPRGSHIRYKFLYQNSGILAGFFPAWAERMNRSERNLPRKQTSCAKLGRSRRHGVDTRVRNIHIFVHFTPTLLFTLHTDLARHSISCHSSSFYLPSLTSRFPSSPACLTWMARSRVSQLAKQSCRRVHFV